jgi:hypothetical protein
MRLLVSGSRGWRDEQSIETVIRYFQQLATVVLGQEFVVIHGHARSGADALADRVGQRLGLQVGKDLIRVPADWNRYGRPAGVIRNQQMLDEQHPDVVAAFRATGKSNGTDDMIARAERAGVPVHVIREGADALALTTRDV